MYIILKRGSINSLKRAKRLKVGSETTHVMEGEMTRGRNDRAKRP